MVGAGNWGQNIVRTLHSLGHLAAVAEPVPALQERAKRIAPGVPVYDDHQTMMAAEDLEGVAVATPVHTHHDVARACLEAGLDVFVEKPLTDDLATAEALRDLAEVDGRILMVGHLLLYQPAVEWMASAIRDGTIGDLRSIHQERLNLGKARSHEDALWSLGVHDVAVAVHLVGDAPDEVWATGDDFLQSGISDDVHLHAVYPGGVRSHLHVSWLWPERSRRTVVVGSKGMLVYDELAQTVTLHHKSVGGDLLNVDGGSEVAFEGEAQPLTLEMEHFIQCIQDRSVPRSGPQNAVDVVRVLQQAKETMHA